MDSFKRYVRTLPAAFWLALLGVAFSLVLFATRLFGEQTPVALILWFPGFLAVAILTAFTVPGLRAAAAVIAALMALLFAFLAINFAVDPGQNAIGEMRQANLAVAPSLVAVHASAMLVAGAAAVSDFRAYLRTLRPRKAAPG